MEKKFYPDNFEQLLKESTDNFRMYPSKRVWHSIYNNLHPGRKWPSLAVWLLLISSVVFIGLSNRSRVVLSDNNSQHIATSATKGPNTVLVAQNTNTLNQENFVQRHEPSQSFRNAVSGNDKNGPITFADPKESDQQSSGLTTPENKNSVTPERPVPLSVANVNDKDIPTLILNTGIITELQKQVISSTGISSFINKEKESNDLNLITKKPDSESAKTDKKLLVTDKSINKTDKEWIEDFAFHNKPSASKWKTHVTYQFYFTPSIGYRVLSKNSIYSPVSPALVAPAVNAQDYKEALSQVTAVNMEIGGNILYSISKKWNLKAGIQLNYTNYSINAYELRHPTMTTLMLNDLSSGLPILEPRSTSLANTAGVSSKRLNNNTYQISLPLGADIKLAGKNNLKLYAGATLQPTYILGGNSYLISSDLKNYVADKSLMNRWNVNAGIETFISYKTKGGIIINAGPQFRYQLFSTYNKQYTYSEKLYNLGLKIGITTRF